MIARSLPGPHTWLPWGSFPAFRRDMLGFLQSVLREYGDVCGFRLGPIRCCVVNEPDLIEEVLVHRADALIKHWNLRQLKFALGNGLLTSEGEAWQRQRRLIQPGFHNARIKSYAGVMVRRTEAMINAWQDGEVRDLHADMMVLTLEVVAETLFGTDLSNRVHEVSESLDRVMHYFEKLMTSWVPMPLAVPTPRNLGTRAARTRLDRVVREIIDARIQSPGGDNLLSWLLETRDEDGSAMSTRQVGDEVVTLLLAGHETTAITLSWTLYLLAQHPDILERLRNEVEAATNGGTMTGDTLARTPFLRAVVQESMRLYPPAWAIGREPRRDIEVGGYHIKKGTQILLLPYITHRDGRFYDDPLAFRPSRWEGDWKPPKYAYFPFGGGPRYCVGSNFAMMEAMMLLAMIVRRWRFELVPDHPVELQATVTLRPRFGIKATVRRV